VTAAALQRLPALATAWEQRWGLLQGMYAALPVSYVRARAAFALALELWQETGDAATVASLVCECVYILDQSNAGPWLAPALLGELGYQVRPAAPCGHHSSGPTDWSFVCMHGFAS
jgi:hypothetical protein